MGFVIDVNCSKCNYNERFFLGMGMRDCYKEVVEKNFCSTKAKEILDSEDDWVFNWKLGRCKACGKLLRLPVLDVFNDKDGKYQFIESRCECGGTQVDIIEVPEPVSNARISCPHCEEELQVSENMLWD